MRQSIKLACFSILILLASLSIFILPAYVPVLRRVVSISYSLGFNNAVSIFATAFFAVLISACAAGFFPSNKAMSVNRKPPRVIPRGPMLLACLVVAALHTAIIWRLYSLVGGGYYGEEQYFLRKIIFLFQGQAPYYDFELAYGPALVYLPAWLALLLGNLGLDLTTSYYLFFTLANYAGLYLLYCVIESFAVHIQYRFAIFLAIGSMTLNLGMGLQYTLLRFITPLACLILIHFITISIGKDTRLPHGLSVVGSGFISLLTSIANFALSPELGIAYTFALGGNWIFLILRQDKKFLPGFCVFVAGFLALGLVFFRHLLLAIFSFGIGGNNFPIFPTVYNLIFLASLLFMGSNSIQAMLDRGFLHGAFYCSAIILVLSSIPGALGRNDYGHVFWYGIGAIILTMLLLSQRSPHAFTLYWIGTLLVFCIYFVVWFELLTVRIINDRDILPKSEYAKLDPYPAILFPLGANKDLDLYLAGQGRLMGEYFDIDVSNVLTEADVERKITDLKQAQYVMAPEQFLHYPRYSDQFYCEGIKYLPYLLLYPLNCVVTNLPLDPIAEIVLVLNRDYQQVDTIGEYALLKRISR